MQHDGMTLSAIAAADGTVSRQTVTRALDEPTCSNGQVEPTKTIGKDGKARPTKYVKTPKFKHIHIHENEIEKILALPEKQQTAVLTGEKTVADARRDTKREDIIMDDVT
jgi:hypothetical protein